MAGSPGNNKTGAGFGLYTPDGAFTRDSELAKNAYARFLAQQRGNRQLAQIDVQRTQGLEKLGSSLARRRVGYSGIAQQNRSQYAQDWVGQRQGVLDQLYQTLLDSGMADMGAWADFNNNVISTEQQRANDILQTALQLQGIQGFMGG